MSDCVRTKIAEPLNFGGSGFFSRALLRLYGGGPGSDLKGCRKPKENILRFICLKVVKNLAHTGTYCRVGGKYRSGRQE